MAQRAGKGFYRFRGLQSWGTVRLGVWSSWTYLSLAVRTVGWSRTAGDRLAISFAYKCDIICIYIYIHINLLQRGQRTSCDHVFTL